MEKIKYVLNKQSGYKYQSCRTDTAHLHGYCSPARLLQQLLFPLLQHLLPLLGRLGEASSPHLHVVGLAQALGGVSAGALLLVGGRAHRSRPALYGLRREGAQEQR